MGLTAFSLPNENPLFKALTQRTYFVHKGTTYAMIGRSGDNWLDASDPNNSDEAIFARAIAHAKKIEADKITVDNPNGKVVWP